MSPEPPLPDYCCAILEDAAGRLLLQRRGPDALRAANRVTCLGGSREEGEPPSACVRRELLEEIGRAPDRLDLAVVLVVPGKVVAWFYRGRLDVPPEELVFEPGIDVVLVAREDLDRLPVHPWHRAALDAATLDEVVEVVVPAEPR